MSSEYNPDTELMRVNAEIKTITDNLRTLQKVRIGLIPESQLSKASELTERQFCEDIIKEIEKNVPNADFDLLKLAKAVKASPVITSSTINRIFLKNFRSLLNDERIKVAKTLLGTERRSVKSVAAACGFTDNHYFSRVFTKITGVNPRQYALMNKVDKTEDVEDADQQTR